MLRFAIALLAGVVISGAAESADRVLVHHRGHRASVGLPAGLPRPHYNFRTTITLTEPYTYPRPLPSVYEAPEWLYAPAYAEVPYIPGLASAPPLPGYYGSTYTYDDQGPNVGGLYGPYWDRLPYACGVYGYC